MPGIIAQEKQEVKQESAIKAIIDAIVSQYLASAVVALRSLLHGVILAVDACVIGVFRN